jgi:hypothetical protein
MNLKLILIMSLLLCSCFSYAQRKVDWVAYSQAIVKIDTLGEVLQIDFKKKILDTIRYEFYIFKFESTYAIKKFEIHELRIGNPEIIEYDLITPIHLDKSTENRLAQLKKLKLHTCGSHGDRGKLPKSRTASSNFWTVDLKFKESNGELKSKRWVKKKLLNFECVGLFRNLKERRIVNDVLRFCRSQSW